MKYIGYVSAMVLAMCLSSCLIQKKKNVDMSEVVRNDLMRGEFSALSLSGEYAIEYKQADSCSLSVRGPKDLVDRMEVSYEDSTLSLSTKRQNINFAGRKKKVTVTVASPTLNEVKVKGACDFKAPGTVVSKNMNFELSGAGTVDFGHLKCDTFQIKVHGAGNLDLGLYDTRYAGISISGAGNADVDFDHCGKAECAISGAGNLSLSGDVEQFVENKSGAAVIHKKGLTIKNK